jgi:hypothetical protein
MGGEDHGFHGRDGKKNAVGASRLTDIGLSRALFLVLVLSMDIIEFLQRQAQIARFLSQVYQASDPNLSAYYQGLACGIMEYVWNPRLNLIRAAFNYSDYSNYASGIWLRQYYQGWADGLSYVYSVLFHR